MTVRGYGPLLDALRGVRWPARRAVGAALPGAHRSRQRGASGEFTEYRLYRQGDDPKQIDWRLLARSDRTFVRLTDDHALVPTWFVVDASRSMDFPNAIAKRSDARSEIRGSDGREVLSASEESIRTKWMVAQELCVGLAAVAHASADPVGLMASGAHGVVQFPARSRRGAVGELVRTLNTVELGGTVPLSQLLLRVPPMARVVIVSDLLGNDEELLRTAAQRTAAGGIVECLHVVAAEEITLPDGAHLASDPDDATIQRPMDRHGVAEYRTRFATFRADMAQQWRASGAGYVEVRTDAVMARVIRELAAGVSRNVGVGAERK